MDAPITIEEFSSLLKSDQESPLLTALSKLTDVQEPEEIIAVVAGTNTYWFGWG